MADKKKITFTCEILHLLWYLLSIPCAWFTSKKNNRVILASNSGRGLSGNSLYLFETWQKEGTFDVWAVISNRTVYEELSKKYNKILFLFSWEALMVITQARFFIITHGRLDIPVSYFGKTVIQTWHGIPFKAVGFYRNKRLKDKIRNLLYKWFDYNSVDYFLTSSPYVTKLLAGVNNQKPRKFLEIGFPRNDVFQTVRKKTNDFFPKILKGNVPVYEKVILYAPTFRPYPSMYFPFPDRTENYDEFLRLLNSKKAIFIVKSHVNQQYKLDSKFEASGRIFDISSNKLTPDIQKILPHIDILITDFSGISIDALLLNTPCIYIVSDIEDYIAATGELCCDYSLLAAGAHVRTMSDLLFEMKNILEGNDFFKEKRKSAMDLFFSPSSCSSTEQLTFFMKELVLSNKM